MLWILASHLSWLQDGCSIFIQNSHLREERNLVFSFSSFYKSMETFPKSYPLDFHSHWIGHSCVTCGD